MRKFHYRYGKRHFYMEQTDPNKLLLTADGKPAYSPRLRGASAYEMAPTVSRGPLPKLLGHTATIEEAKALIEMEANKQPLPLKQQSSLFDQTYQKGLAMQYKKQKFDPNAPGIIAHSRVQVINSANWGDSKISVFSVGIRINLSVMAGEPPWLRIRCASRPILFVLSNVPNRSCASNTRRYGSKLQAKN